MRHIKEHDTVGNATRRGEQLHSGLEDIARQFPFIGDVRGRGLMLGVEIVKPASGSRPGLAMAHVRGRSSWSASRMA